MDSEEKPRFKQTEIGLIPEDWAVEEFSEVLESSLRNGLTKPTSVRGKGVKMVNMGELFQYDRIKNADMERVPLSESERKIYLLQSGDLLFARQSLVLSGVGKCSIFLGDAEDVTFEGHLIRARINKKRADPAFFYYFFHSSLGRSVIEGYAEQVAAAGIRGSDLKKVSVPVPPLPEQAVIAGILSSLDSMVELNEEMNKTLEAIGRAIFKRWFVDFEFPNEEGKPYKSSGGKMVFSDELEKEIPIGWEIRRLKETCHTILRGFTTRYVKKSNLVNLNQKVNRGDYLDKTSFKFYPENTEVPVEKFARRKDILVNSLGQGTLGRVHLFWERKSNIVVDQHITILRTKQEILRAEFLYFYLRHGENQDRLESYITGSTGMLMLNISKIREFLVLVPNKQVQDRFAEIVSGLYDLKLKNAEENESLSEIRDSLLPRIMSGQVRVGLSSGDVGASR